MPPVIPEHDITTMQTESKIAPSDESDNINDVTDVGKNMSHDVVMIDSGIKTSAPAVHRIQSAPPAKKRAAVSKTSGHIKSKRAKKTLKHSRHSDIFS